VVCFACHRQDVFPKDGSRVVKVQQIHLKSFSAGISLPFIREYWKGRNGSLMQAF